MRKKEKKRETSEKLKVSEGRMSVTSRAEVPNWT